MLAAVGANNVTRFLGQRCRARSFHAIALRPLQPLSSSLSEQAGTDDSPFEEEAQVMRKRHPVQARADFGSACSEFFRVISPPDELPAGLPQGVSGLVSKRSKTGT